MSRTKSAGWVTLLLVVLGGCGDDTGSENPTTQTNRVLLSQPRPDEVSTVIDQSRLAAEPGQEIPVDLLGVNLGSSEAPVKVIEFVDFGCGYCRRFQLETFPTVRAEFIETGMIEWKFLPFITGMFPNSPAVTEAAECALEQGPRLFEGFADRLWDRQSEWKGSSEPAALVRSWILELGGDEAGYDGCLGEDRRLGRVQNATALAGALGIRATPTFWVVGGGPIQGALPLEAFRQVFTAVYEQVTASTEPGV